MPLPSLRFAACLATLVAGLAGCSAFDGGEEPPPAAPAATAPREVPIEQVSALEIGRTRDGVVLTAYGVAPGIGYARPRLRLRREGRIGTDGYLDFDFVASPPDRGFSLPQGDVKARIVRADRLLRIDELRGVAGLRVHGAGGGKQIAF